MARQHSDRIHIRETSRGKMLEQGRLRLLCVTLFFVLCFGSITARLVEMMIHAQANLPQLPLSALMEDQITPEDVEALTETPRLVRGDIVDRNGVLLATNLVTASAFANPHEIGDAKQAAQQLARTLRMDAKLLEKRLAKDNSFVWIKRNLTPREQKEVNALGIPGVYFLPEEKRIYPYGNMFSHALGYVGVDNKGLAGLELQYDRRLRDDDKREPLKTTLDMRIQHILHDETLRAMKTFNGIGAAGVVVDATNGEVLAMTSLPDFDPHKPASAKEEQRFNRVSNGLYEMGSTFKSLTLAMALDTGDISPKSGYDASRPFRVANFTISDFHGKNRWLTVPEIFVYSSNIGTARMLLDTGIATQKKFLKNIGMFEPVEIDFPTRAQPIVPKEWKEIQAITISYGHGISVTPLHLARAISALVNGGTMPELKLAVDEEAIIRSKPKRVIEERTSEIMRDMFRLVVTHGTGSKANIAGYRVGGKTGTAEKILASGGYSKTDQIASFVGMFPADNPRYVVYVMVDSPKGIKESYGYATGGWVAAPAVGGVINRMAPMVGIKPEFNLALDSAEQYWVEDEPKKQVLEAKATKPKYYVTSY